MDWEHEGRPPLIDGAEFQVWRKDGDVVRCKRRPDLDWSTLFRTDCWHPLQNAIVSDRDIQAWRLA